MKQQRGIALLTILMMVALATIVAAGIAKQQANTSENTAYVMRQNQSMLYAKSAEAFFAELLVNDAENAGQVDHLQENWAQPMPAFPVEGGTVAGVLQDESGKFNLNSLVSEEGVVNDKAKLWFEKILQRVGLPAELSQAVIDWQDEDDETSGPMGAELAYYRGLNNAALPPNAKFHSVEELKSVRGFEGAQYKLIAPYVSSLPSHETTVNINTAPAFLLATMDDRLDVNAVEQALQQKAAQFEHFENINDLWAMEPFAQVSTENREVLNSQLGVQSNYFKAQIEIILNERKRQFTSELVRKDKDVYVAFRSMAPF